MCARASSAGVAPASASSYLDQHELFRLQKLPLQQLHLQERRLQERRLQSRRLQRRLQEHRLHEHRLQELHQHERCPLRYQPLSDMASRRD